MPTASRAAKNLIYEKLGHPEMSSTAGKKVTVKKTTKKVVAKKKK